MAQERSSLRVSPLPSKMKDSRLVQTGHGRVEAQARLQEFIRRFTRRTTAASGQMAHVFVPHGTRGPCRKPSSREQLIIIIAPRPGSANERTNKRAVEPKKERRSAAGA
jgi:hypothetical protein